MQFSHFALRHVSGEIMALPRQGQACGFRKLRTHFDFVIGFSGLH